jgi:ubiquitin-like 1-activating enzyme E1 B
MIRRRWITRRTTRMVCHSPHMPMVISTDKIAAQEIEKLRQEAQALKKIREAMGTDSFAQLLFDKVYKDDVVRLRSMEEMWKTRRPPEPLDYATVTAKASDAEARKDKIIKDGQKIWDLEENVVVFKDRYCLSAHF